MLEGMQILDGRFEDLGRSLKIHLDQMIHWRKKENERRENAFHDSEGLAHITS